MTKAEFEEEARKVLFALGLDANMPLVIRSREHSASTNLPATLSVDIQGRKFQFSIGRYGPLLRLQVADDMTLLQDTGSVLFSEFNMHLSFSQSQKKHLPTILRVLLHLGYDVVDLCKKADITAHEQLEWALWLQSRETNDE